jgi:hypothetical protein
MRAGNRADREPAELDYLAASVLGLKPGATDEAARAAFLRELRNAEFVPGPHLREAFEAVIGGRPLGADSALRDEFGRVMESKLRTEIEAFAASFFTIAPPVRAEIWSELNRRAAALGRQSLQVRLRALEPGLRVELNVAPDAAPQVKQLAGLAGELFVLRPKPQAIRRQAWLAEVHSEVVKSNEAWRRAARSLRRQYPGIAGLVPDAVSPGAIMPPRARRPTLRPRTGQTATIAGNRFSTSVAVLVGVFIVGSNVVRQLLPTRPIANRETPAYVAPLRSNPWPSKPAGGPGLSRPGSIADLNSLASLDLELKARGRVANPAELEQIVDRVGMTRMMSGNGRVQAVRQLGRELQALGVAIDPAAVDKIYQRCFDLDRTLTPNSSSRINLPLPETPPAPARRLGPPSKAP